MAVATLKSWLKAYNKDGFDGLIPKARNDKGRPRRLGKQKLSAIRGKCRAFPNWTVQKLYEDLQVNDQLGHPPICYNSLLRIIGRENLLPNASRKDVRKRFEMDAVNDMW